MPQTGNNLLFVLNFPILLMLAILMYSSSEFSSQHNQPNAFLGFMGGDCKYQQII